MSESGGRGSGGGGEAAAAGAAASLLYPVTSASWTSQVSLPPHHHPPHSGVMMPACWYPVEVAVRIRRLDHVGRADQHAGARPPVLPATLCTFQPPPPPPHRASETVWGCARPVESRVRHGEPCVRFSPRRGESPDLWRGMLGSSCVCVCALVWKRGETAGGVAAQEGNFISVDHSQVCDTRPSFQMGVGLFKEG